MPDTLRIFLNAAGEACRLIRAGLLDGHTSGQAPGHVQGNVAIVPGAHAANFELFCRRNAQACPLLAMSQPGDPHLATLGADLDIRTDLPRYRIYRNGAPAGERTDISDLWQDGFVTSQSALESARLPLFLAHAPGCMPITDLLHAAAPLPKAA